MSMATKRAWLVLVIVAAVTAFFAFSIRTIKIEGGTVFLPPDHPVELAISRMQKTFGSTEVMSLMMRRSDGTIFTPDTLTLISRITNELEALPGVEEVRSLENMDYMRGGDGEITVEKLMPRLPVTERDAAAVRERALSWEMYRGLLFSEDLASTQWIVTLKSASENGGSYSNVIKAISRITAEHEDSSHHFTVAGEVAVKALLVNGITRDLTFLMPILVVVLIVILYLAFRKPAGLMLPLATVVMSTLWTIGLMALFKVPVNIMGTAIPLLLVTVGSAYGIHFMSHYYEEGLRGTIRKVGLPILLAGVTTIAGFGSLGSASVPAILQMGIFTAIGVLCALILTFTFVPAVLTLIGEHSPADRQGMHSQPVDGGASAGDGHTVTILTRIYDTFAKRPALLIAIVVVLAGVSTIGISRIQIGQPTIDFFRPSSSIRQAARFADQNFGGSTIMYVVVKPDGPADVSKVQPAKAEAAKPATTGDGAAIAVEFNSFGDLSTMNAQESPSAETRQVVTDPRVLGAVKGLEDDLLANTNGVGRISSLTTMVEQMNRVMHNGQDQYYEIPSNPLKYGLPDNAALQRLLAQYLLLYSGNLSSFVNSTDNPTELRIAIQLTSGAPSLIQKVRKEVVSYSATHLRPLGFTIETVGLPDEMLAMNNSIMKSQVLSLSVALLCVLLTIWIAYRSFRIGLSSLIPIVLSLLLNFGAMGFLHIPLDIVTAIIASVAIGIGIDYSIHVVSAYMYEYRLTGNSELAAHRTLRLTGRAIFFNVASVTFGFAVLMFSMFTPLNSVGVLMGIIMITSSFFSLTLLPVVLRAIGLRSGGEPVHSTVNQKGRNI